MKKKSQLKDTQEETKEIHKAQTLNQDVNNTNESK